MFNKCRIFLQAESQNDFCNGKVLLMSCVLVGTNNMVCMDHIVSAQ